MRITLTIAQLRRLIEEMKEEEEGYIVVEAASSGVVKELKRLLYEVLPKKHGVVRFSYTKLGGKLRHAKAEYHRYVPSSVKRMVKRDPDIITYYDGDKHNYRCFHEYQLMDVYPQWSRN